MKKIVSLCVFSSVMLAGPAFANADFAKSKNCMACHAVENKVVGPGYKEVAKKYAGDKSAEAKLTQKIMKGGSGTWGSIPMPANPQVSESEARILAKWILSLK